MRPMDGMFDALDFASALFGALIVAMWLGRGKSLKSLLLGALVGGFAKPIVFGALLLGGLHMFAIGSDDSLQPTPSQDDLMKIFSQQ